MVCKRGRPGRKFTKIVGLGIDGTTKTADGGFIAVARIDHHHIRIINQRIPVGRLDIGAGGLRRPDFGAAHGHNLALQPHFHAQECLFWRK